MSNSSSKFAAVLFGLLLAAAIGRAQPPAITPRGIVNAASQMPPSLAGGKLAPGMQIVIPGIRFIATNSETVIQLEQGSWRASIKPSAVAPRMLKAKLPADTPLGELAVSVVNGEGSSRPERAVVIASSPGIVTLNGEGWGPATHGVVSSGQRVTLQVNGLNEKHPLVFVGGIRAKGVKVKGSNVSFPVPRTAPAGCWAPAWIQSKSGELSNFVTISIAKNRQTCEQAPGWFARLMPPGTRTGLLVLERISGIVEETGTPQMFSFESGAGFFFRASDANLAPLQLLPPSDTCTSYTGTFTFDATSLLDVQHFIGRSDKQYNAGPSVFIESDGGFHDQLRAYGSGAQGSYTGFLGGTLPIMWGPGTELALKPGPYRIRTADAGSEVGKLDLTLPIPPPFEWVNSSSIENIDRSAGLTLQWRSLAPDRQMVAVAFNIDQDTTALGSLVCVAPPKATEINIPPYAFANFPPTRPTGSLPLRFILLASMPAGSPEQPPPPGLDDARAIFLEIQGKTVRYR